VHDALDRFLVMLALNICYREANSVAHELARRGFDTKQDFIWVDETPSFILNS